MMIIDSGLLFSATLYVTNESEAHGGVDYSQSV